MTEASQGEAAGVASSDKLCQSCNKQAAIYKCPCCDMRTCSLPCTKQHREDTGCLGKRSRTGLINIKDFNEKQLLADIRLLEEVEREFDSARRREPQKLPNRLPQALHHLQREASKRSIRLEFLGPGMQKRLQNSMQHDRRADRLLWHVEWVFVDAKLHVHDRRVSEGAILAEVLDKHVRHQKRGFKDDEKMAPYTAAGTDKLVVLMRQARAQVNRIQYYSIDVQQSLTNQLQQKVVVEFPVFLVFLPGSAKGCPLVGDEKDTGVETSSCKGECKTDEGEAS